MSSNDMEFQRSSSDFWFACIDIKVLTDRELSPIDKTVYAILCVHINIQNRKCNLKIKTIADEAGCSVRSVQNSIAALIERGIIQRTERFYEGKQVSSNYRVIGHNASCYVDEPEEALSVSVPEHEALDVEGCSTCVPRTKCTGRVQDHTDNDNSLNDINNTLKRGKPRENIDKPENLKPVDKVQNLPAKLYPASEAPEAMRPTAEYLLLKTGREGLTWEEISALRTLNASHYPSRVQKEIDIATERFKRLKKPLHSLTFCYIAGALQHQHTRSPIKKNPAKNKAQDGAFEIKSSDIATLTREFTEAEIAELEAQFSDVQKSGGKHDGD